MHIPLFTFKYAYKNQPYTAIVEAGTGRVFANIFPAKAEAPYRLAGGLTALVFLCLALFPVIGGMVDGGEGAGIGLALCVGLGLVAAPILFSAGGLGSCEDLMVGPEGKPMSEPTHGLNCPNCGGVVLIPEGQVIVKCPYCDLRSFVRGERGLLRYQVPLRVDREEAINAMGKFLVRQLGDRSQRQVTGAPE